jgi:hypothetical protein
MFPLNDSVSPLIQSCIASIENTQSENNSHSLVLKLQHFVLVMRANQKVMRPVKVWKPADIIQKKVRVPDADICYQKTLSFVLLY